jgi:hypothetical protein
MISLQLLPMVVRLAAPATTRNSYGKTTTQSRQVTVMPLAQAPAPSPSRALPDICGYSRSVASPVSKHR